MLLGIGIQSLPQVLLRPPRFFLMWMLRNASPHRIGNAAD
jgi:hypothetical protein